MIAFFKKKQIPLNYMGVINFAPNLFFILILLVNYFYFSIKDLCYNYLKKLSILQINIIGSVPEIL